MKKPPQGPAFFTISVHMTLKHRHQPANIRRFIIRKQPQTTVPLTLMSRTKSWTRYSHICSLWDLSHATGKPGSSALPIRPALLQNYAISPSHWPDETGSSSIRFDFHTHKNRAAISGRPRFFLCVVYFTVTLQVTFLEPALITPFLSTAAILLLMDIQDFTESPFARPVTLTFEVDLFNFYRLRNRISPTICSPMGSRSSTA